MKIFVAGATGVLGRRVVPLLVAQGHSVTAIGRTAEKRSVLDVCGACPVDMDVFDADAVRRATTGNDVVMNLATCIPPVAKALRKSAWAMNHRLRQEVARNLADATLANGASRFVQESLGFAYADHGNDWITETTALQTTPVNASILDAEASTARVAATGAVGVALRFANFYCADSEQTAVALRLARRGINTLPGDGYWPMVHADDAASAVVASLVAPSGNWRVVDDEQLTSSERAQALADAVGRRRVHSIPSFLYRTAGANGSMLLRSQRVSNAAFKAATGWEPAHASFRTGIYAVARARG